MTRWTIVTLLAGLAITAMLLVKRADDSSSQSTSMSENHRPKPSGFWGSGAPRGKGAYRWKLLGIGVVLIGVTGYGIWRITRSANAARTARDNDVAGPADRSASRP